MSLSFEELLAINTICFQAVSNQIRCFGVIMLLLRVTQKQHVKVTPGDRGNYDSRPSGAEEEAAEAFLRLKNYTSVNSVVMYAASSF